ncbi:MAG: G-D-S-L family lipolytic protein [Bacteroidetes bacterium]|nr:G-D-S-L family lipolytic protein [Bacteroidota bacterium]
MKTIKYLLVIMLCTSMHPGFGQDTKTKTIVMFGNSITYQGKWQETLGRNDVANCGIPGYTTGQLIWTIKNVLHDYPGTKIWFIEGGINDITLGVPVKRIFENQKITIDSLKRNNIIPVVQSTILVNGDKKKNKEVVKLNKLSYKYCKENKIDYINLNALFSENGELKKELTTDGCHLVQTAYPMWSKEIARILAKYSL